ncbi:unnamed protein product [Triticum turgidum subsp. durum]|uniref:Uncharacterized protein n=1 Tax=Triticum turgidum subsp. durum TaxID=4567 RepID=A0A9R0V592_TRITD|nr:unnamed protein product [Triticum turgidum subsp. durum]
MPSAGLSAGSNKVDVAIDLGNPLLNRTVDGFLKIGAVGACRVVAEDAFDCIHRGDISKRQLEETKNALLGGIATGALVSAASNNKGNKIAQDAITGGAIATAVEFINYLT